MWVSKTVPHKFKSVVCKYSNLKPYVLYCTGPCTSKNSLLNARSLRSARRCGRRRDCLFSVMTARPRARAPPFPPLLAPALGPSLATSTALRAHHFASPRRPPPSSERFACSVHHFTILVSAQAARQASAQLTARTDGESARGVRAHLRTRGQEHDRCCPTRPSSFCSHSCP